MEIGAAEQQQQHTATTQQQEKKKEEKKPPRKEKKSSRAPRRRRRIITMITTHAREICPSMTGRIDPNRKEPIVSNGIRSVIINVGSGNFSRLRQIYISSIN